MEQTKASAAEQASHTGRSVLLLLFVFGDLDSQYPLELFVIVLDNISSGLCLP